MTAYQAHLNIRPSSPLPIIERVSSLSAAHSSQLLFLHRLSNYSLVSSVDDDGSKKKKGDVLEARRLFSSSTSSFLPKTSFFWGGGGGGGDVGVGWMCADNNSPEYFCGKIASNYLPKHLRCFFGLWALELPWFFFPAPPPLRHAKESFFFH